MSRPTTLSLILLLPALLGLSAAAVSAAPGPPALFPVSSCSDCPHDQARVAGSPSGRFLVVWDGRTDPQERRGVVRRLFEPAGLPRGTEAAVSPRSALAQDSAVAADARGYVAVWSEQRPDGGSIVLAQRFRPLGSRLGQPIVVAADIQPGVDHFNPAVTRTPDGGFVVAWIRHRPVAGVGDESHPEVYGRAFSPAGAPLGPAQRLSAGLASGDRPDLCADAAGRVAVVWTTVDAFRPFEPSLEGVSLRLLLSSGVPLGNELIVARPLARRSPAAVSCSAAGFVVAWASDQAPAVHRTDIVARRFTRRGRALGTAFLVNDATAGEQLAPALSHDLAGRFVVVWQDSAARALQARRFAADGTPVGAQLQVRSDPEGAVEPFAPDVAHVGAAGNFVVVWREGSSGLFGRLFPASAALLGHAAEADAEALWSEEDLEALGSGDR